MKVLRGFESLSLRQISAGTIAVRGDVAQLGERLVRNEEVSGSIPLISTTFLLPRANRPRAAETAIWPPRGLVLTAGSRAIESRELRQDRKVAAVSDFLDVPRTQLTRARRGGAVFPVRDASSTP